MRPRPALTKVPSLLYLDEAAEHKKSMLDSTEEASEASEASETGSDDSEVSVFSGSSLNAGVSPWLLRAIDQLNDEAMSHGAKEIHRSS